MVLAFLAVFAFGSPQAFAADYQQIPSGEIVLSRGHVDVFDVTVNGGELQLLLKEDVTGSKVLRNPEDMVLHVEASSYSQQVASVVGAGGYYLPQTQDSRLLWPGWDTQGVAPGFSSVVLDFLSVDGPGEVFLFGTSGLGTVEPLLEGGALRLDSGSKRNQHMPAHTHANWVFTQPGQYTMQVRAYGQPVKGGQIVSSEVRTYTWWVGDLPGASAQDATVNNADSGASGGKQNQDKTQKDIPVPPAGAGKPVQGAGQVHNVFQQAPAGSQGQALNTATPGETLSASGPVSRKTSGSYQVPANTHAHPNWVFSAPGDYTMTMELSVTTASGQVQSARTQLRFLVGDGAGAGGNPANTATSGHFDLGALMNGGALVPALRDDRVPPSTWIDPQAMTFTLGQGAHTKAPAGLEFVAQAGQDIWMIGSTQVANVPWLGVNSQHPTILSETTGPIQMALLDVQGPGNVAVFSGGGLGQVAGDVWFSSVLSAGAGSAGAGAGGLPGVYAASRSANRASTLAQTGGELGIELSVLAGGFLMVAASLAFYHRRHRV
ncbi:MAG: choice-of-anchor M domain-containing protein [Actinomycetaceae bacterium]|nr:choice-of-anchor M domain-containing protein [Actinomycetaceae bacterium]